MGEPDLLPLRRLLDPATADALLAAFAPLAAGSRLAIVDTAGRTLAGQAPEGGARERSLRVANRILGALIHDDSAPEALTEGIGRSLEAILARSLEARDLASETLDRYREVNLLYGIAESIGGSLDAAAIPRLALAEAGRAIRSDVAVALVDGPAASIGDPAEVDGLLAAAAPLIERVRTSGRPDIADGTSLGTSFDSALAVPIRSSAAVSGALLLARRAGGRAFTASDEKLLAAVGGQAGIALETARLHLEEVERRRLDEELAVGRRIQLSLLPRSAPVLDGWEIATAYRAARQVGGDFYDFIPPDADDPRLGVIVADVTGKGVPAALMMAYSRAILCAEARADRRGERAAGRTGGPGAVLDRVNRALIEDRRNQLLVSAMYLSVEPSSGRVVYASAGHDWPFLVPAAGPVRLLEAKGVILGAFAEPGNEDRELRLAPGDLLVLYSDGITEARSPDGDLFGEERLVEILDRCRGHAAGTIAGAIVDAVDAFAAGAPPFDDITLVVIRRAPATTEGQPETSQQEG